MPRQDVITDVVLQPDTKIVAVGSASYPQSDFLVVRYKASGDLDPSFGSGGVVTTDFGPPNLFAPTIDVATSVALLPDGKIVVAGFSRLATTGPAHFALARYNSDGSLDATFGAGGRVLTDFGQDDRGPDLALGQDGTIVAVGWQLPTSGSAAAHIAIARYEADGSLGPTFEGNGKLVSDPGLGLAKGIALQAGGKIVVGGLGQFGNELARYTGQGSLDTTFGNGGRASSSLYVEGLAVDGRGRILAGGSGFDGTFGLARFDADGHVDGQFGNGGFGLDADRGRRGRRGGGGRPGEVIVAAGYAIFGTNFDFALTRHLAKSQEIAFGALAGKTFGDDDFPVSALAPPRVSSSRWPRAVTARSAA